MNHKKRIAIVLTGRLIINEEQYQNFKKYFLMPLSQYDIHMFVCYSKGYSTEHIEYFKRLYNPTTTPTQFIQMTENDEQYVDISKYTYIDGSTRKHNMMSMFLSRYRALQLLEKLQQTGIEYDLVISSRSDLWFTSPIPFESYLPFETFTCNGICIPENFDYGGINDQCAFGCLQDMKTYLNLYSEIIPLLEDGVKMHPETLLKAHLDKQQVNVHRCKTKYSIKRY
jgi:hypothetical protein